MESGNKISELRKKQHLSQEQLAEKMNVARQTISKWELGETSPDIRQAKELSKIFKVSLDELAHNDIKDIVIEKVTHTEKKTISIFKIIIFIFVIVIFLLIFLIVSHMFTSDETTRESRRLVEESIYCTLYGEEHGLTIRYEELTGYPKEFGGDSYFADILGLGKYKDAHKIFNIINDYVKKNDGTCQMIQGRDLSGSNIVDMSIKEGTLTSTSVEIIIKDTNPNRIVYGSDFYIEKYVNSTWKSIGTTGENYGFDAMAYYVDENGILEMRQDWSHIYGELDNGIYRIVKHVFFGSDTPIDDNDIFYIWTEFEIK